MEDRWLDRLSEYLDDELTAAERAELEVHLGTCADCRAVLTELRQVVRTAAALPDEPPAHDLWPAIEAKLGPVAATVETKVISLVERRRRFAFTLPQLAAAGVALMVGSAGIVWLLVARGPGAPAAPGSLAGAAPAATATTATPATTPAAVTGNQQAPSTEPTVARGPSLASAGEGQTTERPAPTRVRLARATRPLSPEARADRDYNQAVADLQGVLRKERSHLKPETVKVLESSLADIDKAIADARHALARDPANVYLNAHLAESKRLKLELLQQVATITQS